MIIDLQVGDVLLKDVEIEVADGKVKYTVPDVINDTGNTVQQVTIDNGATPEVNKTAIMVAVLKHIGHI